jgi:hypothetical protein
MSSFLTECAHAVLSRARAAHERAHWRREDRRQLHDVSLPVLPSDELQTLRQTWPFLRIDSCDLAWARLYKKVYGFDPYFLGSVNQFNALRTRINPYRAVCSLENKALLDVYFPEIPFPEVYVRCLNGQLFDAAMRPLTIDDALRILQEKGAFVIKPALESMCGKGVRRLDLREVSQADASWLSGVFAAATSDFVVQEIVAQDPSIARLNPTSLNCCRVTSVYVGGRYTCAALQKIGKAGSLIDNWNSAYFIGVLPDGRLKDTGWDDHARAFHATDGGVPFAEVVVPGFAAMLEAAESFHKQFLPQCGIVGWDMVVDANGCLKVIEANLTVPGLPSEQLCSGPFLKGVHAELCHVFGV